MNLASRLQTPIAEAFVDQALTRHDGPGPFISFAPRWQGFGVLEIHDDGDEVTVYFGSFTHAHYGCYEPGLTEEEAADYICRNVIEELRLVFADRIEFFAQVEARDQSAALTTNGSPNKNLMHLHQRIKCSILFSMRTTLDIDDDILAAARELAKAEGRTMGEVITDLARRGLTAPLQPSLGLSEPSAPFRFDDWPTLPGREGVLVTPEMIERIQEELDLEDATPWDHDTDKPRED